MGNATITNSISWDNYSGINSNDFSYTVNVRNSIFESSDGTNGNISQDPMFVAPDKNDFRLRVGSPGINAGVNEDVPEWLTTDGLNNDRILESVVDLGVFEGGVESPKLLSPLDGETLESEILEVLLTWEDGVPEDVSHYMLEYSMNEGDPVLVENLQNTAYNLSGLSSARKVAWRICSVTDDGQQVWSEQYHFSVLRGRSVFVTPDGTGNGASWSDAMSLQDALTNAMDGDSVWVAAGIYKPTETTSRDISFSLPKNIKMFGGFEGTETEFSQRNHVKNKTILSGDIGEENVSNDNSYHVLSAVGTYNELDDWRTVVDGFIVENGYADGYGHENGGGIYLECASPLLVNMHFKNNYAFYNGGAVYDAAGSQAEFANVLFTNNSAGYYGGAVYGRKNLRYYNCVWFNNTSTNDGGAAFGYNEIYNSIFWKNSTETGINNDLTDRDLVSYSIFENGNNVSNLAGDPGFIDAENGDFRLREESMALNAGDNDAVPDWLVADYFGKTRILEETIDLGISEGEIVVASIIFPEDHSVVSVNQEESVVLKWSIEDSELAATISGFKLEWVLGEDTTVVENIEGYEYTLSELVPFDGIDWRVGYYDENGNINWSDYTSFNIYRGHPIFVVVDGTGDGTSWENGIDLKEALNIAVRGDSLWISEGIYKPTVTTDRTSSFVIDENYKLFGGFTGVETFFEERNTYKNQVVLSGDIGEPGVESDNSYHVVRITGSQDQPVTEQMILDGVTIENGFADVYGDNDGGGLIINSASPIIKNVWFRNNFASDDGGAVYVDNLSNPLFGNVLFWKNESGDDGGAVYSGAQVNFYNCVWLENYSGYYGGAVYDNSRTSMVYNSIAWDNEARWSYDNFHYGVSSFYSIFNNAADENGNLNQEPGFVSVDKEDFRLKEGSPAINSGNIDYLPDWLTSDFYGNSRLIDDVPDIGIFEGSVIIPRLLSPLQDTVYHISSDETVLFEWTLEDVSVLENVSAFQLEYIVNHDTILIEGISEQQFEISGFQPTDSVSWSVSYTDEQEFTTWSAQSSFFIGRGHPVFVAHGGTGDGSSWATATNLQNALDISVAGDSIWVAAGTYKPTDTDDRNISFEIKENVKLFGGFAGTETKFAERNLVENQTILSGDIGEEGVDTDNSYHVFKMIGSQAVPITLKTVVDGLVIEKGYADEQYMDGGGLLLEWASPIVRNVWLRDNYAVDDGGAVYGDNESHAQYGNVIFTNNESGGDGGAVYSLGIMKFFTCLWYGNISGAYGGAVYSDNAIVNNSIAWGNSSEWSYNDFTYWVDVTNSIYSGGYSGDDNISQNPDFVDPSNNDFRLKEGSPAINAGSTESIPDWLSGDYYGNSRVDEDIVDMGAIEGYVITPVLVSPAEESWLEADFTSTTLNGVGMILFPTMLMDLLLSMSLTVVSHN
ncbi:choice-of-anchor Q domain-containing protein [Marinilabilia salmonicolor]|uniref:choice-of-anchor Q domain-containing protein n=1 Tax=Marinilabilia salmonicolor TaxID=989 RepID=UPI0004681C25|nr:choice-of-anchor Q domain-containing protein [Marinilabilia salmonicolor]